jgi:hypothetical protein
MRTVILVLFVFITAGCVQTGEFIRNANITSNISSNITPPEQKACIGIVCTNSTVTCKDNSTASCTNKCNLTTGKCSSCVPDCTGHECVEEWVCTNWSSCSEGKQTRICNDTNSCGTEINNPAETQDCIEEDTILIEYVYSENPEWVRIANNGNRAIDMSRWSLNDEADHIYIFPIGFVLGPYESVRIHTEKGSDTKTDLYMNKARPIWNNDRDKATLRNEKGTVIDEYAYPKATTTSTTTTTTTTTSTTTTTKITTTTTTTPVMATTTTFIETTTVSMITTTTTTIPTTTTILGTLYVNVSTDKAVVVRGNAVIITTYVTDGTSPVDSANVSISITYASGSKTENTGLATDGIFVWEKTIGGNSKPGTFLVDSVASKEGYKSGSASMNFEVVASS